MKVWISKYALTKGLYEEEVRSCPGYPDHRATVGLSVHYYRMGQWHETLEAAQAHAKTMQQRKLASLRRQIAKLEALRFEPVNAQGDLA